MESKVYSSLFALVDSHLSQTSLRESSSNDDTKRSLPIPNVKSLSHNGSVSESFLHSPNKRLPIPTLSENNSQILDKLSEQVANMLKAKEKREIEEKQKLEEKSNKMETDDQDYVIDLMKALQTPCGPSKPLPEDLSKSSSTESIFELNFNDFDEDIPTIKPEPLLPCITDMSYILKQKIKHGKCSTFGKVLTSRLKTVPAPYIKEIINSNIVRFDFSTKSPCDIIKEKLRKPTSSCTSNYNIA
ncbi:PREDICTED: uncharacterized protein LOC106125976 [Papilio xuthus]|uniref:Uncharacterized protein LOC106125976 n=1 Tax=Papilio xuthus TaxID=66420 RepID=A0AAJ6ZTD0_PAPXU|nr:PREDICTED: uncharacterized protein LOC106125976 [Papilio xuthus]